MNKNPQKSINIEDSFLLKKGLSDEEVSIQIKNKLSNRPIWDFWSSYFVIVIKNLFNWFNIILFGVAIAFLILGVGFGNSEFGISKYAFLIIVFINLIIGVYQECKAKRTLNKLRIVNTPKIKVLRCGEIVEIMTDDIVENDLILVERGIQIPVDGIILDGFLALNESMLTGEQIEKKKTVGDMVFGGTIVNEGTAKIKVTAVGKKTYSNKLKKEIQKQEKPKSEMVRGVHVIVLMLSLLIIPFACVTGYTAYQNIISHGLTITNSSIQSIAVEIGTTIVGAIPTGLVLLTSTRCALSIISLYKKNTAIRELRAVEGLAYSKVVCLDKTGTLTTGKMVLNSTQFIYSNSSYVVERLKSVLALVPDNSESINALRREFKNDGSNLNAKEIVPFNSKIKYSGCVFEDEPDFLFALGAPSFLLDNSFKSLLKEMDSKAKQGYRIMVFVKKNIKTNEVIPLCYLVLSDEIRPYVKDAIEHLIKSNVELKIFTGDNPLTASYIAKRLGFVGAENYVDLTGVKDEDLPTLIKDKVVFGRCTPEQKKLLVQAIQKQGKKVTMVIDGLNDLLACKASDCSVAISHEGAAPAVSQVADVTIMDGSFIHMPEIIKEGRKSVNDIERSSTLFLMKSFLALGLSGFSPLFGHLPYSIEGLYLVTWFITGLGGFLLGLEDTNDEIKVKFFTNVLSKSIPSSLFLLVVVVTVQSLVFTNIIPYAIVETRYGATLMEEIKYDSGSKLSYNDFQTLYNSLVLSGQISSQDFYRNIIVLEEPLAILSCVIASFAVLLKTIMPLNKFRIFAFGVVVFCVLFFLLLIPNFFLGVDSVPKDVRMKPILLFGKNSCLYYLSVEVPLAWIWLLFLFIFSYPILSIISNLSNRFIFHTTTKLERIFTKIDLKNDDSLKNSFKFLSK